ncbi:site-2 protease family protein [Actinomadura flavalba]|uniref:site-2 protease family protein n=1 Tax=Actinomadura flavalba TaxID=1120938 RepID=UPI0003A3A9E6|nr:site-2 protease family protein [Actinomadura flavalba]
MGVVHERRGRSAIAPSPVFLALVAITVLLGLMCWRYGLIIETQARVALLGFVLAAWIVTLCVHEFAHAYLAFRSGDHSVAVRGYLTLNPFKYADTILSFAIPVLFILLGGIGLPGGAVWLDRGAIRGRLRHSLVSAAGPLSNVLFAIMLGVIFKNFASQEHALFWAGIAFLGFLQVTAALLNLLPIPGLDGFGIIEPYLPRRFVQAVGDYGGYAFFALIVALWLIPPLNEAFFGLTYGVANALGLSELSVRVGHALFRFWEE